MEGPIPLDLILGLSHIYFLSIMCKIPLLWFYKKKGGL